MLRSLGPIVVVDELVVLLVLRSELMLDVDGDDVEVSEPVAPGLVLEPIVELEGEEVLVSELMPELGGLVVELEPIAELEGPLVVL